MHPFDIMPGFWDQLIEKGAEKTVLIDKIKSETYCGDDELSEWLQENQGSFNVCEEFGIEYVDLLAFLREIQMRIA